MQFWHKFLESETLRCQLVEALGSYIYTQGSSFTDITDMRTLVSSETPKCYVNNFVL